MRREVAPGPENTRIPARSERTAGTALLRLHGSCVHLGGRGVVLSGRSGSGKSDLALRLIDVGAVLVADDQLLIERAGGRLLGRPAETLVGLLEVRGLGILRLPCRVPCELDLVVELDRSGRMPRLPSRTSREILGVELPCIRIDPRTPSAAAAIRLVLTAERVA